MGESVPAITERMYLDRSRRKQRGVSYAQMTKVIATESVECVALDEILERSAGPEDPVLGLVGRCVEQRGAPDLEDGDDVVRGLAGAGIDLHRLDQQRERTLVVVLVAGANRLSVEHAG